MKYQNFIVRIEIEDHIYHMQRDPTDASGARVFLFGRNMRTQDPCAIPDDVARAMLAAQGELDKAARDA